MITALEQLLAKVEAGLDTAHDHARAFPSESAYGHCTWHDSHKASNGKDMTAAMAVFTKMLGGWWRWNVSSDGVAAVWPFSNGETFVVRTDDPARAMLLAILCALIAQEGK